MKKETSWQCESCGEKNPNAKKLCMKCKTAKKPWQMKQETRNKKPGISTIGDYNV